MKVAQLVKIFPAFDETQRINSCSPAPNLNQVNPIQINRLNIHFNAVFLKSSEWSLHFRFVLP